MLIFYRSSSNAFGETPQMRHMAIYRIYSSRISAVIWPCDDISAHINSKWYPVKFDAHRIILDKIPVSRYIGRDLKQWQHPVGTVSREEKASGVCTHPQILVCMVAASNRLDPLLQTVPLSVIIFILSCAFTRLSFNNCRAMSLAINSSSIAWSLVVMGR